MAVADAPATEGGHPYRVKPRVLESVVRGALVGCAAFVVATTIAMLAFLAQTGIKGIAEVGLGQILTGTVWKPEADSFGGFALIAGTFATAVGAILIGAAPAVLSAVYLTEFASAAVGRTFRRVMEIASAVPSVVYGWLALVYLTPLTDALGHGIYGADAPVSGVGIAASAILLAIMIAPTVLLLSLDALSRVPRALREASAALGASPWQTAFNVSVPYGWRGVLVAVFYGFARAAGETMAVQMVIGGARRLPANLFSPTTTISAQIVMDMQEARPGTVQNDVLFSMALVLLVVSVIVVLITRTLARRQGR
ncbi:MAG TPA: phosphate ABC transporter permease subunit PstC [Polyangiaceae bacterium]|jgi:phosphate transport system permease protein|nr:phosphate ABC transporter permease subunit PstC [Polyangiaceae bacterium]